MKNVTVHMSPISPCRECVLCVALPRALLWRLKPLGSRKFDESETTDSESSLVQSVLLDEVDSAVMLNVTQKVLCIFSVVK